MFKNEYFITFSIVCLLIGFAYMLDNELNKHKIININSVKEIQMFENTVKEHEILNNKLKEISSDNYISKEERMEFYDLVKKETGGTIEESRISNAISKLFK